ncbi:MAG: glycosyltransferase [Planctomycetes bacterium]|nr:glycosyltransferase [Planctomycetota bacterium]
MSDSLTIVLLTKNEAGNIGPLIVALKSELALAAPGFLVIDASHDATPEEARAAGATVLADNSPYGVVLTRGLRDAASEWVLVLDADGSHLASDARRLWEAREGADLVVGSRFAAGAGKSGQGAFRAWLSRRLAGLFAAFARLPARDVSSGFRLYRRALFADATPAAQFFNVQPELLAHAARKGARVREVGITYAPRGQGQSKARVLKYGWAFLKSLWRIRRLLRG